MIKKLALAAIAMGASVGFAGEFGTASPALETLKQGTQAAKTLAQAPAAAVKAGVAEADIIGSYSAVDPQFYFSYDSTLKINADHTVEFRGEPTDYDARDAGWEKSNTLLAYAGKGNWQYTDGKLRIQMSGNAIGPDSQTFDEPLSASLVIDLSGAAKDQLQTGAKVPVTSFFFKKADTADWTLTLVKN